MRASWAHTEVVAAAEGRVLPRVGAEDVEVVGILEHLLVPVARGVGPEELPSALQGVRHQEQPTPRAADTTSD